MASNAALTGSDTKYTRIENRLAALTARRHRVADRIKRVLDEATFDGVPASPLEAGSLLLRAVRLVHRFDALASSS